MVIFIELVVAGYIEKRHAGVISLLLVTGLMRIGLLACSSA